MQSNEVENWNENMQTDTEYIEGDTKESFFHKHGFIIGVASSLVTVALICAIILGVLRTTGQILIIGENGASKIESDVLLKEEVVQKLDSIYSYMNIYYYEDFEKQKIYDSLYSGLMQSLDDPYSVYYTAEEYENLKVNTSGIYYGIGAALSQNVETMKVTISKVYRGTPAEEAGLKNGDTILTVGEYDASSMEVSELVQHIRGKEGTKVHMVIFREATGETLEFDVERRNVELPSIEGEMLDHGIAYIQVTEFQSKTDEQFAEMVQQLQAQGMKGLIVDVRANPGGMLTSVVNLLDTVLPEGLLVYIEDKYGNREEYKSNAACLDVPIVVLVDENSASASEIFAGALKDYEYATLIGKTTYGKGIVQNIIQMPEGDAIKLTTAKYFTPKGNYIHGEGIAPDIEVAYEYTGDLEAVYDKQYDSQFRKAVEVMKELLEKESK